MSKATDLRDNVQSLKRHGWIAVIATFGLFGGLVAWAMVTEISGAIVSSGTLMVQSNAKQIQHPEGGVVAQLLVRNEDPVIAGQLLVVLDQTSVAATLEATESQLRQLLVKEARLLAEIDGSQAFDIPGSAIELFGEAKLRPVKMLEQQIFEARRATTLGRKSQLREQILQLERQREGFVLQEEALINQIDILQEEIADFDRLFADRLVTESRGTTLRKDLAAAKGQLGQVVASIAESNAAAAEKAIQITQVDDEYLTAALAELAQARQNISEFSQRRLADLDRRVRTEIRSPQSGIIHQSVLHTIGGVAPAGQTLMTVIPTDVPLLVNSRIETVDVDRVYVGQKVVLRFPGLDPRTTPELIGHIEGIAPDIARDEITGAAFYPMRVSIQENELSKLSEDISLLPGMPVETYVHLADRTVLGYLIQPFVDHLRLALREE